MKFLLPMLFVMAGCTATGNHPSTAMRITFLGSPSCPNTPKLRENLKLAVDKLGVTVGLEDINQDLLPDSDPLRRYPTPTILLNDHDLYGLTPSDDAGPGCRIYSGGLPTADDIAAHLVSG